MNSKRAIYILASLSFSLTLLVLAVAGKFATGTAVASNAHQNEPSPPTSLAAISEMTGLVASTTATSPACTYDVEFAVYLCPDVAPLVRPQRDEGAAVLAREMLLGGGGLLLIPDSLNDRVMAFDPVTGDLVDANFIPADTTNLSMPKNAILSPSGDSILVSDQIEDVVQEYDFEGNYMGVFAPAGGADETILDNILGIALRPNGNLLVTVNGGVNQDTVAEFDTAGNYLGNFISAGSGGLDAPFDVYQRTADWLVSGINSNNILRYNLNTGAFIAELAAIDNFPQQISEAANGNILIGNFIGDQEGVVELTAAGALVDVYNPAALGGNRGAYELPNGNILTTNGDGVHEIDRDGNLVESKIVDVSAQYIEFLQVEPAISLDKTVGTNPATCATTAEIAVEPGTAVFYCYQVTNIGDINLTRHDLEDSELGPILSNFSYTLVPGASAFLTQTTTVTTDTVNLATWTAYNPGPADVVSATDVATVTMLFPSLEVNKTVGTGPGCATTDSITVITTTAVTYCYVVTNIGPITLTRHDLVDSELGTLLDDFPFTLVPGASAFLTATTTITQTTINTATWTAETALGNTASDTDTATVLVGYFIYLPIIIRDVTID